MPVLQQDEANTIHSALPTVALKVHEVCGDKVIAQGQLLQTQVTEEGSTGLIRDAWLFQVGKEKPISNVEDLDSEQQSGPIAHVSDLSQTF